MDEPSTSSQGYNTSGPINMLDDHVLWNIFRRLALRDRVRMERVCKRWKEVSKTSWSNYQVLVSSSFEWHKCYDVIAFQELLLRCGNYVQHLQFPSASTLFPTEAINIVIKFCPNLKNINMALISLNVPEIRELTRKYRNLNKITLGEIESINCEPLLRNWYIKNKNLETLKLTNCVNVSGRSLLYLPKTLRGLIIHNTQVKTEFLIRALKNFNGLKRLILDCYYEWYYIMNIFREHCRNLETLKIITGYYDPFYTCNTIMNIANIRTLRCLTLWHNSSISDEFLDVLTLNCQQLVCIDINNCRRLTDIGLRYLVRLLYLRYLSIREISSITATPLYELSNLEILHCRGNDQFNDNDLVMLVESLPKLKLLNMSKCHGITDGGISKAIEIASNRLNKIKLKILFHKSVAVCEMTS